MLGLKGKITLEFVILLLRYSSLKAFNIVSKSSIAGLIEKKYNVTKGWTLQVEPN